MPPSLSVIIPAYNNAHTIADAIKSVQEQVISFSQPGDLRAEIIVVDDGSTDNTQEVLSRISAGPFPVRVIKQKNKGAGSARNTGIRQAQYEYIAFLNSNDTWISSKLAYQFAYMSVSPHPLADTLCLSYYLALTHEGKIQLNNVFLKEGRLTEEEEIKFKKYSDEEIEQAIIADDLWYGIGSTLLAHRDAIEKTGPFDEEVLYGEDAEYITRHLIREGKLCVAPLPLMTYSLPDPKNTIPAQEDYLRYVINTYKDDVAQRWGQPAAAGFARKINRLYGKKA